jgi:hypothetical protein
MGVGEGETRHLPLLGPLKGESELKRRRKLLNIIKTKRNFKQ